jgi:hypothetical protein
LKSVTRGGLHQPLDLGFGQVFPRPAVRVQQKYDLGPNATQFLTLAEKEGTTGLSDFSRALDRLG